MADPEQVSRRHTVHDSHWTTSEAAVDAAVQRPARLEAVERASRLQLGTDEALERVTALGVELLGAPVCFVATVHAEHDHYPAHTGFGEPLASGRRLEGRTFCHYTLTARQTLAIDDTHAAEPWASVPTVRSLGVRAYLGVPIEFDGEVIGSLCAVDAVPHPWTPLQIRTLQTLAESLQRELALRQALDAAERGAAHVQALMRDADAEVSMITHDLKAPLAVFGMAVLRLGKRVDALPTAERARGLDEIVDQLRAGVGMMRELVDDLRHGTRARAGPIEAAAERRVTMPASSLLEDALRVCSALAASEGVQLEVRRLCSQPVRVDAARVLRALTNLIHNALKYSGRGSTVALECRFEAAHGRVDFIVHDEGGIAPEELPRLFDKGFQGRASLERGDGTGLGLPIVRGIAREHGGEVVVTSAGRGHGTTATLSLPVALLA